jgi:hypothetical protein
MQGASMSADADHELIDSPEALFRHLYEEHGVSEARDLDPETAPLQFWLRRHADLERAERAARRQPDPAPEPPPPEPPAPEPPAPPSRPREAARPQPAVPPPSSGRRPARFGDPLVEAVARALAGRGHGEAAVRSAMRSFAGDGGGPAGEAAVRAVFVEPMLQAVAERLLGAPPSRSAAHPTPPPPKPAAPPPDREEPVRPEAAWAVLWADLGERVRRPGDGAGTGGDGDDLMAVANAVQARRRVRVLRR